MSELLKLQAKYSKAKLIITGHSLGGAIATISAVDLIISNFKIDEVYTFGSHRVGDIQFSNFIKNKLKQFIRVVN
jgi:triacylglycerol lipase